MAATRARAGMMGAATALALLACAQGGDAAARRKLAGGAAESIGSFTPAAADPRRGAAFAISGLSDEAFRFTPSAATGRRRLTVAVRARVVRPEAPHAIVVAQPATTALASLAPTAYSLGASIGWKRFALSGDVSRLQGNLLPIDRESMDLGLSFSGRRWVTRVQLGADRPIGGRPQLLGADQSYSVDLGGSYALGGNLEVTGGVRYKMQRDRFDLITDERRDSQSVYVGTAFRF